MSYKLTNKSGGLIVCDLKSKTLRLNNKKSITIQETEITSHINNLISKGLILSEKISEPKITKKDTTTKKSGKTEKEE